MTISSSIGFSSDPSDYSFKFPSGFGLENISVVTLDSLEIKTVAGFSNNHCVKLLRCRGIEDIESLSSVKVLTIDNCAPDFFGKKYDYSIFSNVPRFKLFKP